MPELPEVQTTVDGLNQRVKGRKIIDVWTDIAVKTPSLKHFNKTTKSLEFFKKFKKNIIGTAVLGAHRRGKNILIDLSSLDTIWIHMKMTGHLIYGKYELDQKANQWRPSVSEKNKALFDPYNQFLHTVFSLDNGKHLVLSDMRKFAKISILKTEEVSKELSELGPEPLSPSFTHDLFIKRLQIKPKSPIKLALLDQSLVVGIGNIYSDEALWRAGIHPFRKVSDISNKEMKVLHKAIQESLTIGIELGGDSMSDYRNIDGERGEQQSHHRAYKQTGKNCKKRGCTGIITRIPFGGRNAHFCLRHQI